MYTLLKNQEMKHYLLSLFALTGMLSSCQNATVTNPKADSIVHAESEHITLPGQECYSYIKDKDTIALSLHTTSGKITGDLTYSLYEKDRNYGTISGEMKGDTLLIDYTFDSEGMHSARQIAFLKKENQLMEGFGDVEDKNGEMVFKDPKNLQFSSAIVLTKTDCN